MGLAMMGIGTGLGIPAPLTAGMVISGAFFGDKMSSISDSTNLAPAAGDYFVCSYRCNVENHPPSYIITLIAFTVLGLSYRGGNFSMDTVELFLAAIGGRFHISPLVLVPMAVLLLILNLRKYPAVPRRHRYSSGSSGGSILPGISFKRGYCRAELWIYRTYRSRTGR